MVAINAHDRTVYSVSWGVGKPQYGNSLGWLATAGGDGSVKIWELNVSGCANDPVVAPHGRVQAPAVASDATANNAPPEHRLIATLSSAHGVNDVNTVSWSPRAGMEDILATTGDDGVTRVWKIIPEQ